MVLRSFHSVPQRARHSGRDDRARSRKRKTQAPAYGGPGATNNPVWSAPRETGWVGAIARFTRGVLTLRRKEDLAERLCHIPQHTLRP